MFYSVETFKKVFGQVNPNLVFRLRLKKKLNIFFSFLFEWLKLSLIMNECHSSCHCTKRKGKNTNRLAYSPELQSHMSAWSRECLYLPIINTLVVWWDELNSMWFCVLQLKDQLWIYTGSAEFIIKCLLLICLYSKEFVIRSS